MTKNEKGTPGPWIIRDDGGVEPLEIVTQSGKSPAIASVSDYNGIEEMNANAALIAVAPQLLAVAEEIEIHLSSICGDDTAPAFLDILKNARAAIAKAKGK